MFSFNELKKNLKRDFSDLKKIRLAILSDSASQLLANAVRGYGYAMQLDIEIYEAEYNQIDLQIFDQASELYNFKPDFIFINRSSEKLLKDFYGADDKINFFDNIIHTTLDYYNTLISCLKAKIIINTLPEINDAVFGNFAAKTNTSFIYQLRKINVGLMELSQQSKDLFVCDIASLQSTLGYQFIFDPKMYVNASMVYTLEFLPYIAKHINDILLSITGWFKKCLVLDLDNTVWGGIIGDDGVEGIQIGELGTGKAFTELQLWAKQLKERGIILAVCSKNTEELAKEPFLHHPDMVLKMDHIAVFVANWETKVDNLRYIQSVLNISFDSMVFVDDNAFEREMVKSAIPEITVPDMPDDPAEYLQYLRRLNLFETASFTEEDGTRTRQYQEEAQRNVLLQTFDNENDFLANLQMVAEGKPFNDFSVPRVAQLTQRSNQFNLRTIRYTEEDIKRIAADSNYITLTLTLKDRFGDHGLIGVIILQQQDIKTLFIDSWIMSCRVLKRGMENFTMNTVIDIARAGGFDKVVGEYIPTKKNGIVKDHYADLGFEEYGGKWIIRVAEYEKRPTFITNKN